MNKQKYVLTINSDYMGKSKLPVTREFDTFAEMEIYKLGVIMGLSMDSQYKLWDLWDFKIMSRGADNEQNWSFSKWWRRADDEK